MAAITLIGPGRHGSAIARLFASHGVGVTLYHHRPQKADLAAASVRQAATGAAEVTVAPTLAAAASANELIILTTPWDSAQRAVISELGDALAGKVLLDVSNPLDITPSGVVPRRPAQGSAGQFVASLLPRGAGQAKAFSNLPTVAIAEGADRDPLAVLPFAADSHATAELVRPYLAATGWLPWLIGDISRSAALEIGGELNVVQGRWGRARLDAEQMLAYWGPEATIISAPNLG
ncbi:NADPH-dependent F420 reductase [Streptomyces olivochromogenes]|uniref:NADPH-dependent F420 reductase n=1 Tax=Streptomyces TaxID=1883 RepID=UPI00143EE462|nr:MULTISPECIES: NAD(P)-binding domain-containing protein [Streptomyces]QIY74826.1 NAD(P)-binding domain-containing protein [Streptomyces sp. RLB1-33]QUW78014.1 NAD(P)-binding domain-containing protein [Streptomyces mirabilis]